MVEQGHTDELQTIAEQSVEACLSADDIILAGSYGTGHFRLDTGTVRSGSYFKYYLWICSVNRTAIEYHVHLCHYIGYKGNGTGGFCLTQRKRGHPLTKEEILDKALEIIDSDGLSALSMRRLGAALGIDPMMIYRHIPNKETLLDLTLERMRSRMVFEKFPDTLSETLEIIFTEYLRVLSAHPNMLPLAMRRPVQKGVSGIQYIIDSGIPESEAVDLFQSMAALTVGYAFLSSPMASGKYEGVSAGIAEKLKNWTGENFSRTLRAIMNSYNLDRTDDQ